LKLYDIVVERPTFLYTCAANGCETLRAIAFTLYPQLLRYYIGACPVCGRYIGNRQKLMVHLSHSRGCSHAFALAVEAAARVMRKAQRAMHFKGKRGKLYIETPNGCDTAFYITVRSRSQACVLYAELVRYWMDGHGCIPWWLRPTGFLPKPLPPTLVGLP